MTATVISDSPPVERVRRREVWLAAVACLALAGLHLAIAAGFGALGVPRNDDWTYYRIAFASHIAGGFAPDPFTSTMLVGLIVLATPVMSVFGAAMAPLQVMVALVGALGLWSVWMFVRPWLDLGAAAVAVLTLALGPMWGTVSTSFMSDAPAFTAQALALLAARTALRGPRMRWGWFTLSLTLCFAAFTVREYAAAALVAVFVAASARSVGRRTALALCVAGLLWIGAALLLLSWRAGLVVGAPSRPLQVPGPGEFKSLVRTLYTIGLLLSPAVVLVLVRTRGAVVLRHRACAAVTFVGLALGVLATDGAVLLGNLVADSGSYPETVGGPIPTVVATPIWALIVAVALLSTTVVLTVIWASLSTLRDHHRPSRLVRRLRGAEPGLVLALAFSVTVVMGVLTIGFVLHTRIFDRYLMPMTPYAAAAILWTVRRHSPGGAAADTASGADLAEAPAERRGSRLAGVVGGAFLVVLATLGTAFVAGSAAFDGAKWRLGERAVAAGFEAETVDAGLEWFGLHQTAPIVMQPTTLTEDSWWVTALFADPHVCALVTHLPQGASPGGEPGAEVPGQGAVLASEQVWAPLGPSFELALRRTDRNCPE